MDAIKLAQDLIRCPSVTPADEGALDVLAAALAGMGFAVERHRFGVVDNLYARFGQSGRNLCFAGHTDVVPVGDRGAWSVDPFAAVIQSGKLYGRGAADMKAAIAAWVAAISDHLARFGPPEGSLSLLITGDEEGPSIDGTIKLLDAITQKGERLSHCLVGEPTSEDAVADTVKNGRRGSLNVVLTASGKQGHAAYPEKSANPVPALLDVLTRLKGRALDDGAPGFQPSNLEITTVDVGNPAHNVIPAKASAKFNIRFNTAHSGSSLESWIAQTVAEYSRKGVTVEASMRTTGEPFYCPPDHFTDIVQSAIRHHTGQTAHLSTSGGTSDARFIHRFCPVLELGLRNETAHKVDEHVEVEQMTTLKNIYADVIAGYFAAN